jgi:hypothetical protein
MASKSARAKSTPKKAVSKQEAKAKATKKAPGKKAAARKAFPKRAPKRTAADVLDLAAFPSEAIVREERGLCLACTLDIFTRHLGIAPARARAEIKRHEMTLKELSSPTTTRPYFAVPLPTPQCPYCGAPSKWHATFGIVRIEGGKSTDAARRALLKKLNSSFTVIEEKSTERDALYHWLAKTGASLDLDSSSWLLEATQHWLGRRFPKENWAALFQNILAVRRSRRLQEGFEVEAPRLFLAPHLFDEVLLIQYLLSRSHKAGGLTFEGRLTLQDLFHRLRGGGYLRAMGVTTGSPSDALEQLMELLGGEGRVKFHYIVDRRQFLGALEGQRDARIPESTVIDAAKGSSNAPLLPF